MKYLYLLAIITLLSCSDDNNGSSCSGNGVSCVEGNGVAGNLEFANLANFTSVEQSSVISFELIKSNQNSVTLAGDRNVIAAMEPIIVNGKLSLDLPPCFCSSAPLIATINYSQTLTSFEISGTGNFESDELSGENFELSNSGTGNINMSFSSASSLVANVQGTGNVELEGRCTRAKIDINGTGDLFASNMETDTLTINLLGTGSAEVFVNDLLSASLTGTGDLCYKGSPTLNTQITGTGNVTTCE